VVQGRDDDLDPVVVGDPQPVEQVLLGRTALAEVPGRRVGAAVS